MMDSPRHILVKYGGLLVEIPLEKGWCSNSLYTALTQEYKKKSTKYLIKLYMDSITTLT